MMAWLAVSMGLGFAALAYLVLRVRIELRQCVTLVQTAMEAIPPAHQPTTDIGQLDGMSREEPSGAALATGERYAMSPERGLRAEDSRSSAGGEAPPQPA